MTVNHVILITLLHKKHPLFEKKNEKQFYFHHSFFGNTPNHAEDTV